MRKNALIATLFILISSGLLVVFSFSSRRVNSFNEGRELLLRKWKKGSFYTIKHDNGFTQNLPRLLNSAKEAQSLSSQQKQALVSAVEDLFFAYHDGSLESYLRFRFPKNTMDKIVWNEEAVQRARREKLASKEQVEKYYNAIGKTLDPAKLSYLSNNYDTLKEYFQMTQTARVLNSRFNLFCASCWKAVNLDAATLKITWQEDLPQSLAPSVLKNDNLGKHSPVAWFHYQQTPAEILASEKKICVADLRFVVKTDGVYEAYPVYVEWYWAPDLECWLPNDFHVAVSNRDINYMF